MVVFVIVKKYPQKYNNNNNNNIKESVETIKEELLNSLEEIDDEDKRELEELVGHIKSVEEAAGVVRRYEKILKTKYRGETR